MAKIKLTRALCWAAGLDEGNRAMRKGNRTSWSRADFNAATQRVNKLLDIMKKK